MSNDDLSLSEARRIALAAQGFDRPRPSGRIGPGHLRRTIRQLGLVQIDYVNVLLPAQYQVPFSRLGTYETARLDDLVYRHREFTEQSAHEASIVLRDFLRCGCVAAGFARFRCGACGLDRLVPFSCCPELKTIWSLSPEVRWRTARSGLTGSSRHPGFSR